MPKLQQIKRANGSLLHFVNLPLEQVVEAGWEKGDELVVKTISTEHGIKFIIFREEDIRGGDADGGIRDIQGQ